MHCFVVEHTKWKEYKKNWKIRVKADEKRREMILGQRVEKKKKEKNEVKRKRNRKKRKEKDKKKMKWKKKKNKKRKRKR